MDQDQGDQRQAYVGQLQRLDLVPARDLEHARGEVVVAGQPGVLHAEQGIAEVPRLDQVGGDQPVLERVLEGVRPLRQRDQQGSRGCQQRQQRQGAAQAGERVETQPADRQDLDGLQRAVPGEVEESAGEEQRIDGHQVLA